jgi:hypothetical protein
VVIIIAGFTVHPPAMAPLERRKMVHPPANAPRGVA